jgi:signal peptidase complex subunit 2
MASKNKTNKKADEKPVKVDKWDGSALKNALDDAAKLVLTEKLGFVETHKLVDGRLFLCTIAVGFAVFALVWDYLYPFPLSRTVLITCVLSYFIMMVVLTFYTTYHERGIFMVAIDKDKAGIDPDNIWRLASRLKRYDDQYELYMSFTDGITGQTREASFVRSVANFFDENGYLCNDLFDAEVSKLQVGLTTEKKMK